MKMKLFYPPLILFVFISTVTILVDAQNNEMDCATAARDADCVTCLTEGCVHTAGECLSSCDFIADASCWDMKYHENKTVEEVCQQKDTIDTDNEICGDESLQSDCGACTSKAKSVEGTCEWYVIPDGTGYCGSGGCGMNGICGSTECAGGDDGGESTGGGDPSPCLNFPGCEPCLNSRIECAWIGNSCQASCDDIADAACYHPGVEAFDGMIGPDICAVAVENGDAGPTATGEESSPCNGFDYCEPCLNSRIECAWIGGGCEASCDMVADATCYHPGVEGFSGMNGPEICAKAIENSEAKPVPTEEEGEGSHPCNGFDYCEPCLNSRIECAWIGGVCEPSCDMIADAACYHPKVDGFVNMTGPEICAIAIDNGDAKPTPTPQELETTADDGEDMDGEEDASSDDKVSAATTTSQLLRLGVALPLGFVAAVLL